MFVSIYNDSKKIEIPFDSSTIQFEKIVVDDRIMIPFHNPEAVQAVIPFIKDNEKWTTPLWGCSDYDNTRLWLHVNIDGNKPEINLITEIVPPKYTDKQEQKLLQSASQAEREDTYSDYLAMMDMLDIARNWHNEVHGIGEMYHHPAELNDKEIGEIMYAIVKAMAEDNLRQIKEIQKLYN